MVPEAPLEQTQEDFLVLAGDAVLLVEGEGRALRALDFVHCPPGTNHVIVDEAALRHGAGVEEETSGASVPYARCPPPEPVRYPGGLAE